MSHQKHFFSIVIPTYNCADFIVETVEMVKGQSFGDWELVMVDDGSMDQTWEILKGLADTDFRIKIDQRPEARSKGPSACRNIGVESAMGLYIAFLDADDEWSTDRLQNAYHFIQKTRAKAIYSGAWVVERKRKYFRKSRAILEKESVFDFVIKGDSFAPTPSLVVASHIAKKCAFPENLKFHEDFEFFIEVSKEVDWIFLNNQDIIIHWEDNHLKKLNYTDCLWFYHKNSPLSRDKKSRLEYLKYMAHELASRNPRAEELREYFRLLQKETDNLGFQYWILFNFPLMYFWGWKIRMNFSS